MDPIAELAAPPASGSPPAAASPPASPKKTKHPPKSAPKPIPGLPIPQNDQSPPSSHGSKPQIEELLSTSPSSQGRPSLPKHYPAIVRSPRAAFTSSGGGPISPRAELGTSGSHPISNTPPQGLSPRGTSGQNPIPTIGQPLPGLPPNTGVGVPATGSGMISPRQSAFTSSGQNPIPTWAQTGTLPAIVHQPPQNPHPLPPNISAPSVVSPRQSTFTSSGHNPIPVWAQNGTAPPVVHQPRASSFVPSAGPAPAVSPRINPAFVASGTNPTLASLSTSGQNPIPTISPPPNQPLPGLPPDFRPSSTNPFFTNRVVADPASPTTQRTDSPTRQPSQPGVGLGVFNPFAPKQLSQPPSYPTQPTPQTNPFMPQATPFIPQPKPVSAPPTDPLPTPPINPVSAPPPADPLPQTPVASPVVVTKPEATPTEPIPTSQPPPVIEAPKPVSVPPSDPLPTPTSNRPVAEPTKPHDNDHFQTLRSKTFGVENQEIEDAEEARLTKMLSKKGPTGGAAALEALWKDPEPTTKPPVVPPSNPTPIPQTQTPTKPNSARMSDNQSKTTPGRASTVQSGSQFGKSDPQPQLPVKIVAVVPNPQPTQVCPSPQDSTHSPSDLLLLRHSRFWHCLGFGSETLLPQPPLGYSLVLTLFSPGRKFTPIFCTSKRSWTFKSTSKRS